MFDLLKPQIQKSGRVKLALLGAAAAILGLSALFLSFRACGNGGLMRPMENPSAFRIEEAFEEGGSTYMQFENLGFFVTGYELYEGPNTLLLCLGERDGLWFPILVDTRAQDLMSEETYWVNGYQGDFVLFPGGEELRREIVDTLQEAYYFADGELLPAVVQETSFTFRRVFLNVLLGAALLFELLFLFHLLGFLEPCFSPSFKSLSRFGDREALALEIAGEISRTGFSAPDFTQNWCFVPTFGKTVFLPYSDLVWCYRLDSVRMGMIRHEVWLYTRSRRKPLVLALPVPQAAAALMGQIAAARPGLCTFYDPRIAEYWRIDSRSFRMNPPKNILTDDQNREKTEERR